MIKLLKKLWNKFISFIYQEEDEEQYCSLPENIELARIQRAINKNKERYSLIQDLTVEYHEENQRISDWLDEVEAKYGKSSGN